MKHTHITTERTSKKLKLWILLSVIGTTVGVLWLMIAFMMRQADMPGISEHISLVKPMILLAASLVIRGATKFLIWWHHG